MRKSDTESLPPMASVARVLAVGVVLLTAYASCRIIIRHKLAQAFFEQSSMATAYAINPNDGLAAGYLAWTFATIGRTAVAEPLGRQAVTDSTLSEPGIGALAIVYRANQPKLASILLKQAAQLGWRDPPIQIWLAREAQARGEADAAARHADAAARIQGVTSAVRALVDDLAKSPTTKEALLTRLKLNPDWRIPYLLSIAPPTGDISSREAIFKSLVSSQPHLKSDEKDAFVNIVIQLEGMEHGYSLWRDIQNLKYSGNIYDPNFENADGNSTQKTPFSWLISQATSAHSEVTGNALHVSSDGTAIGTIATQIIHLPVGRHTMTAHARYSGNATEAGFRWSIFCMNNMQPIRQIQPFSGTTTGSGNFVFDIPRDDACAMQALRLTIQQTGLPGTSEAWFNNVEIK